MQRVTLALVALALCSLPAATADAQSFDRVRVKGSSIAGKIISMTPVKVVVDQNGVEREVEVNEITSISFAGEPTELTTARLNLANGRFEDAREQLNGIDSDSVERDVVQQDIAFYKALCNARLAMGGNGDIKSAGKEMYAFVNESGGSYHLLQAKEILGDIFVALGNFSNAEGQYADLAKAPWPDYKMRAGVLVGRALQAQNKHAEAIAMFDKVKSLGDDKQQMLAATLGTAVSMAHTGKIEPAIQLVHGVIEKAEPEDAELHARAYNALGHCYRKANKDKDALLAFLHVDVLYYSYPEAHAEALSQLQTLWEKVGKGDRARQASATLRERYPGSRWAN